MAKCRACAVLLVSAMAMAGCSSDKFVGRPDLTFVPDGVLPAPSLADLSTPTSSFVIGPADKLSIDTLGIDEQPREIVVDPSGNISVPLAGSIHAAGLTSAQLSDLIASRMRTNFVKNPVVTVNVAEVLSQAFTVGGEVARPGIYPIGGRTTLMRAIARSEGLTEFARDSYVVVFRTVQGRQYATLYDLRAIRQGLYRDPEIYANDEIIVGGSEARRLFKDVVAAAGLITAPVIAVAR